MRVETEGKARAWLGKPLDFPSKIRHPSTTNTIPIPEPRQLPGFQPHSKQYHNTIIAHSDKPYIQNYEKISWKPRFHELLTEHESKMRLLKNHSHTSERQGNEASKVCQKRERKEGRDLSGWNKTSTIAIAMPPATGGKARKCPRKSEK